MKVGKPGNGSWKAKVGKSGSESWKIKVGKLGQESWKIWGLAGRVGCGIEFFKF